VQDEELNILQQKAAEYVINEYESPNAPVYPYHNLQHTRNVVLHSEEMASHYRLSATDRFILTTAAWFHDIGHLYGPMPGHEERGALIMEKYLAAEAPQALELTPPIRNCILATKMPSHPANLLQRIICDADTYHLGTDYFRQTDPLVRKEMTQRFGAIPSAKWKQKTLALLRQHTFFTDYCQTLLNQKKQENIAWFETQSET
jgi:predicted metal-dependent HD superfamily phosphohydrolase